MTTPLAQGRISPFTGNLMIGKGIVLFQRTTDSIFYHLGNVPSMSITPKTELLDHYTSMSGALARDAQAILRKSMDFKLALEEMTARNLALLMLGDVDFTNPDAPIVDMFVENQIEGHLKFFASNTYGPRWYIDLPSVQINPSGALETISEKYASVEVTGAVNSPDLVTWGTMTLHPAVGTIDPECVLEPFVDYDSLHHGNTMVAYIGGWIGITLGIAYQWNQDGVPIYGATSSTYTTVVGDEGHNISVTVTGTNAIGSTTVTSLGVGPVVS
jgi:hypothetical protein